jgi:hypothetical protein
MKMGDFSGLQQQNPWDSSWLSGKGFMAKFGFCSVACLLGLWYCKKKHIHTHILLYICIVIKYIAVCIYIYQTSSWVACCPTKHNQGTPPFSGRGTNRSPKNGDTDRLTHSEWEG